MATVFAGSQLGWRLADYEELSSGQADGSPNQNHYQHVVSLAYPWATKAATKAETEPNACALAFIASFWFAICFDFSSLITFLYFVVGLYCFVISNCCQFPADMTFHAIHVCLTHFALFSLDILPPPALYLFSSRLTLFLDFDICCHGSQKCIFGRTWCASISFRQIFGTSFLSHTGWIGREFNIYQFFGPKILICTNFNYKLKIQEWCNHWKPTIANYTKIL